MNNTNDKSILIYGYIIKFLTNHYIIILTIYK